MANEDYYKILGVSKNSSADEIKRAYRKLAVQYHPDKNKEKGATDKFKEVTKAYEVLGDPQKRQQYDQFGAAAFEQGGFGGAQGGPFGGFGGAQQGKYGPFSYTYTTSGDSGGFDFGGFSDPFEIFEQFFGGASPFGRRERRPVYSLTIDFMEAIKGTEKTVNINGKTQKIKIPQGVNDGSRIRFGDYDILIDVRPDKRFKREGADIVAEQEISFSDAAMGETIDVNTVQGKFKLRIPSGTQPDTVIRLRGKGAPHVRGGGFGDHYVRIKITVPKGLTNRQKELLKQFNEESKKKKTWF